MSQRRRQSHGSADTQIRCEGSPPSEIKDDLSRYLREAERRDTVITRPGEPAGLLVGFESEDDGLEYRLEHEPGFLQRIEKARENLLAGRATRIEDLDVE